MMSNDEFPYKFKSGFWSLDAEDAHLDEGDAKPKSLLKTTEWGLMTIASLLASLAFPPYFVTVMTLAFLNAGGLLWVTHLNEKDRQRLKEFEIDFRHGHNFEEKAQWIEAVGLYLSLKPRYGDIKQLEILCDKRAEKIKREHAEFFPTPAQLEKNRVSSLKNVARQKRKKKKKLASPSVRKKKIL